MADEAEAESERVSSTFDPKQYWSDRIAGAPSLRATGHASFSLGYNRLMYAAQAETLAEVLARWDAPVAGKSVLDAGCGVGFYTDFYQSRGAEKILGLDIAPASVEQMTRDFPRQEFRLADIGSEEFVVDDTFDIVNCVGVLYHLVDDQRFARALRNLCLSLRPGGHLILSGLFTRGIRSSVHVRFRALEDYAAVMAETGVQVLEVQPVSYLMNRTFVRGVGPKFLSLRPIAHTLHWLDRRLRRAGLRKGGSMKFLIARAGPVADS
jgi:SAM-dependent methyltransferase